MQALGTSLAEWSQRTLYGCGEPTSTKVDSRTSRDLSPEKRIPDAKNKYLKQFDGIERICIEMGQDAATWPRLHMAKSFAQGCLTSIRRHLHATKPLPEETYRPLHDQSDRRRITTDETSFRATRREGHQKHPHAQTGVLAIACG